MLNTIPMRGRLYSTAMTFNFFSWKIMFIKEQKELKFVKNNPVISLAENTIDDYSYRLIRNTSLNTH